MLLLEIMEGSLIENAIAAMVCVYVCVCVSTRGRGGGGDSSMYVA